MNRKEYLAQWHRDHPEKKSEYYQRRKYDANLYQRERSRRIKREFIKAKGGKCMDCKLDLLKRPECGQFDHRNPATKLFNIRWHVGRTQEDIQQELDKCDLVCANCHFTRTVRRYEEAYEKAHK